MDVGAKLETRPAGVPRPAGGDSISFSRCEAGRHPSERTSACSSRVSATLWFLELSARTSRLEFSVAGVRNCRHKLAHGEARVQSGVRGSFARDGNRARQLRSGVRVDSGATQRHLVSADRRSLAVCTSRECRGGRGIGRSSGESQVISRFLDAAFPRSASMDGMRRSRDHLADRQSRCGKPPWLGRFPRLCPRGHAGCQSVRGHLAECVVAGVPQPTVRRKFWSSDPVSALAAAREGSMGDRQPVPRWTRGSRHLLRDGNGSGILPMG